MTVISLEMLCAQNTTPGATTESYTKGHTQKSADRIGKMAQKVKVFAVQA